MTDECLRKCLTLLEGKVNTTPGTRWSDAVSESFAELLLPLEDDFGRSVVELAVYHAPGPPKMDELRQAIERGRQKERIRSGEELPPITNVEALSLLRQGFSEQWARDHPDEPLPLWFRRITGGLSMRDALETVGSDDLDGDSGAGTRQEDER